MKLYRVVFTLALIALPAVAMASQPQGQAAPGGYLAPVLLDLVAVAVAALSAYLVKALNRWAAKIDSEHKIIKEEHMERLAERVVSEVEERAADLILREGPDILRGEKKLEAAVAKLLDYLPGIDEKLARELARAALVRLAAGASDKLQREREKRGMRPS